MTNSVRRQHQTLVHRYLAHTMRNRSMPTDEIAARLSVSPRTVCRYLSQPRPDVAPWLRGAPDLAAFYTRGACGDHPELDWFTDDPAEVARVKEVCRQCPVLDLCRSYAQSSVCKEFGIWGAMTQDERDAERRGQVA